MPPHGHARDSRGTVNAEGVQKAKPVSKLKPGKICGGVPKLFKRKIQTGPGYVKTPNRKDRICRIGDTHANFPGLGRLQSH